MKVIQSIQVILLLIGSFIAISLGNEGGDCIFFPPEFKFGVATAAYQIEGAWNWDGKGMSIWDDFVRKPGKIADHSTGDVACDHYNRSLDDIKLISDLSVKYYRLSISWSRIFPNGTGDINLKGVEHYRQELKGLKDAGIHPVVTLYHWDLPLFLQNQSNGFLNDTIVDAFANYAETCFQKFGEFVDYWITFNEPHVAAWEGFGVGVHAPGRCSPPMCNIPNNGDSTTEPYIVAHNMLLSHAKAVDIFRKKYKKEHQKIGISLNSDYSMPLNENDKDDISAAARYLDFQLGWFAHPILKEDYPQSMKTLVGERLPKFTADQLKSLTGSIDFLGINHYTSTYVKNGKPVNGSGWVADKNTIELRTKNGVTLGPVAQSPWLYVYPPGIRGILNNISTLYGPVEIWITENGVDSPGESNKSEVESLIDGFRLNYLKSYISELHDAITKDKVNVTAYFIWSLLDNFEWAEGYISRFGIYHVNYADQKRTLKHSGNWFRGNVVKCKNTYSSEMVVILIILAAAFAVFIIGAIINFVAVKKHEENNFARV